MQRAIVTACLCGALAGCAALPIAGLGAIGVDIAAVVAGVSYVTEAVNLACDAGAAYDDIEAAMNKSPNATVQDIISVFCGSPSSKPPTPNN